MGANLYPKLLQSLTAAGCRLVRQGKGSHEIWLDRKSTRLNSSHLVISYAVFCLKKTIRKGAKAPIAKRVGRRTFCGRASGRSVGCVVAKTSKPGGATASTRERIAHVLVTFP